MTIQDQLNDARLERSKARLEMNIHRFGTKAWRNAEDDLNFWQGKVANLEALVHQSRETALPAQKSQSKLWK